MPGQKEASSGVASDLPVASAGDPDDRSPFKGDMDLDALDHALATRRERIALVMAGFAALLPKPPLTRDMVKLAVADNVVSAGAQGFEAFGIAPTSVELILPTYMDRHRRGGRWSHPRYA